MPAETKTEQQPKQEPTREQAFMRKLGELMLEAKDVNLKHLDKMNAFHCLSVIGRDITRFGSLRP